MRLTGVVILGDKVLCSVQNIKTKKSYWVKVNEELPELEGYVVSHIDRKNTWIELKKQNKTYILAASGMRMKEDQRVITVEESGLSSMVRVFEQSKNK